MLITAAFFSLSDLYEIRKGEKVDISEFEQIVADATEQIKNNKYN